MKEVCIDANIAVKWAVLEEDEEKAKALLTRWQAGRVRMIVPASFPVEVDSVIRRKVALDKVLTEDEGDEAVAILRDAPVEIVTEPHQRIRAWELAKELNHPVVYDTYYLALAEIRGCEFWTADRSLFDATKEKFTFVRFLRDYRVEEEIESETWTSS
jgi:predicted nucleic acid-binding protein